MAVKKRVILTNKPAPKLDIDFLESQKKFFREFVENGFEELFDEINPITDYANSSWEISFEDIEWGKGKMGFKESHELGLTYDVPVYVNVRLVNKRSGEIKKQKIFLCDMPIMSDRASFMVNGNERVVVFQIIRSEGVLFGESKSSTKQKPLYSVKLMPHRGKWYEFEMNKYGVMSMKLLEKRPRILLTTLLRALGYSSNEDIQKAVGDADTGDFKFLETTFKKDPTTNTEEALIEIYRKLRPEDSITLDNSRQFIENMFFNKRRFYLGKVGRYKLNQKLGVNEDIKLEDYLLKRRDIVEVIKKLIKLNNGTMAPDDIDSLSNRRIRGINEIVSEKLRVGILIMEKNIRDRMSTYSTEEKITPAMLVNTRPLIAAINQFFGSSALLRYMDQENILSELEAKRKITAGGPKGLTKERATFSVRDVHNSHYARLCPVTTPEGPSVGMVNQISIYSKINDFGFMEAPFFRVVDGVVTDEVVYLDYDNEYGHKIATSNVEKDENGKILDNTVYVRENGEFKKIAVSEIDLIDISPSQIAGLGLALMPFANNDDPNRAFYGAKTQNQAVPLLNNEPPIVGTGFESLAAKASGRSVFAVDKGVVLKADTKVVEVEYENEGKVTYQIEKFVRTNQNTAFTQHVVVVPGQKFEKDDVLVDGPCVRGGELALGVNLRTAYVVWDGANYEDGIVISERLVREDILTSVHIYEYTQEIRETKLGDEIVTRDIPGVGERALRNLDEEGIVRIGANVDSKDILVGIIAPKGETELSAEEKLLRAIFGEYAREVRDNSLRMPHGEKGVVTGIQVLDRKKGAKLNAGVIKQVKVWVARTHKISIGDKLTGYHGEKGIITKIIPEADMPYTNDGKPVDIILGPASMIRRMNLGQLIETHVAELAHKLGVNVEVQPFSSYSIDPLIKLAEKEGLKYEEKVDLYDGRTGEKYDQKVTVGMKYVFKLDHLADNKVHARSVGPYTLVTQQPLRGKAQMGGQRLGEMEVWALQAHAVPNLLHEMLTIKSDDVVGRAAAYKAIISGQPIKPPTIPASFDVLDKELAGLAIKMDKIDAKYDYERMDMALEEIVDSIGNEKYNKSSEEEVL